MVESGPGGVGRVLTVVVPASPLLSHPDTVIIDETLASVRHHLPDAPIWVTFDGVRAEQEHLRDAYEEHIQHVITAWDATVSAFPKHMHQVGMLRAVIDHIDTPLLMYIEADAPLLTDRIIDWDLITGFIQSGRSNCIRLYHEEAVPEAHRYLMFGMEQDAPLLRTSQYSARPHVATVEQYRKWLTEFSPHANTFLEDKLHSVVQEGVKHQGWWSQKVHIYAPDSDQGWRRSGHLDGRAGGPKFDDTLVF